MANVPNFPSRFDSPIVADAKPSLTHVNAILVNLVAGSFAVTTVAKSAVADMRANKFITLNNLLKYFYTHS